MNPNSNEFYWAVQAMVGLLAIGWFMVIIWRRSKSSSDASPWSADTKSPIHFEQVVAGTLAYGYYVLAGWMAGAEFPKFLRDHLFDGFGPAVLVGLLLYRVRQVSEAKPNPDISPRQSFWLMYLPSAAVFGLIAAAAVFSSGKDDFVLPVISAGAIGGLISPGVLNWTPRRTPEEHTTPASIKATNRAETVSDLAQTASTTAAACDLVRRGGVT